jgi:hypothetical protein
MARATAADAFASDSRRFLSNFVLSMVSPDPERQVT